MSLSWAIFANTRFIVFTRVFDSHPPVCFVRVHPAFDVANLRPEQLMLWALRAGWTNSYEQGSRKYFFDCRRPSQSAGSRQLQKADTEPDVVLANEVAASYACKPAALYNGQIFGFHASPLSHFYPLRLTLPSAPLPKAVFSLRDQSTLSNTCPLLSILFLMAKFNPPYSSRLPAYRSSHMGRYHPYPMISRYNKNRDLDVIETLDMDEPFEEEPSSMHLRPMLPSCEDRDVSSLDLVLDSRPTGDVPSKAGQNKDLGLSVTVLLNIFHALRRQYLYLQTVFLTTKKAVAK